MKDVRTFHLFRKDVLRFGIKTVFVLFLICVPMLASASTLTSLDFGNIEQSQNQQGRAKRIVKGLVTDSSGEPLIGVSVMAKGYATLGTATDVEGKFQLIIPKSVKALIISYVGFDTYELKLTDKIDYRIKLKTNNDLKEVVVTGYQTFKKNSFTGNTTVVTKKDLLKTNDKNAISALQVFDPSFRLNDTQIWGSDPNNLPEFTLRGESSIGLKRGLDVESARRSRRTNLADNPNLPIFILDGFPVSVQKIYDLDINRIESMTILKDAAATALYGSRAANGVIVVTTVAPKSGELRGVYNFTGGLELPDFTDYNLCNAEQMLEIEKLAGLYSSDNPASQISKDVEYNDLWNEVRRGVRTDWLAQPVRNVFNQGHSLNLSGGVESIRYSLDLNYKTHNGVMRGSYRNVGGVGLTLDYRFKDWLQVMNYISWTNTKSENSPYGDFSLYARLKPYWAPFDNDGNLLPVLGKAEVSNPLYSVKHLGSYSGRTGLNDLTDNLSLNITFMQGLTFKGQLSVTRTDSHSESFMDPKDAIFKNKTSRERGSLTTDENYAYNVNLNALLYYNKTIGKHFINAMAGYNAQELYSKTTNIRFLGFQLSNLHSPTYAAQQDGKANVATITDRLIGLLGAFNYSYDNIYLVDLSFRMDGSSKFGKNARFAPFWSAGLGLNIHSYEFMKDIKWINTLRVRGSYGITGNVNFPSYAANTTYLTSNEWYYLTPANTLLAIGNPNLTWEKTKTSDIGLNVELFNRRLSLEANYYHKETVDQLSELNIRTSSGFSKYFTNAGTILNKGYELRLNVVPYQDRDWMVALNATLSGNKNIITKLGQDAQSYNKKVQDFYNEKKGRSESGENVEKLLYIPLTQYFVGASTTAIYAVPSMGIDPSTGKEIFIKRDGSYTNTWDSRDEVVCGDKSPMARGAFGFNLAWKGLYLNTSFLYQYGAKMYNETILYKVEQADIANSNVDVRVLTKRWKKPGDVASFYDIKSTVKTQPTSRFVQDDNFISLNSLSLGYDFKSEWIKKYHLTSLGLRFNANDIFRWASIKQERGINYPYSKTYSFTLTVGF